MAGPVKIMAVVKANAYGHGSPAFAAALEREGVDFFGVAMVEEGIELRRAGITGDILVLGGPAEGSFPLLVEWNLTPALFEQRHLVELAAAARAVGRVVKAHVKVDTGMSRVGLSLEQLRPFLAAATNHPEVQLDGMLSQLANADVPSSPWTERQISRFQEARGLLSEFQIFPSYFHLANSAALASQPDLSSKLGLNMVRLGVLLYGLRPYSGVERRVSLRPVMSWKTRIVALKRVPAGTPVSYGSTWTAKRETALATLPLGYADGYSRRYSNRSHVLVRGRRAPLVGRVCMDMCMVDVTDVPGAEMGDEVVLLGEQGGERIDAEELALLSETINYEVVCAIAARVSRRWVPGK